MKLFKILCIYFLQGNFSYVECIFYTDITFLLWSEPRAGSYAVSELASKPSSDTSTFLFLNSVDFRSLFGVQFQFAISSFFDYVALLMRKKKYALGYLCQVSYICIWVKSGNYFKVWVKYNQIMWLKGCQNIIIMNYLGIWQFSKFSLNTTVKSPFKLRKKSIIQWLST